MKTVKHNIRDIIIWLIDNLGFAARYRARQRRRGPLVRVLCFHDVPDRTWFASVLDLLVQKYHVITPDQFHAKQFVPEKINVLLTFDDGYQSWIDHCLPELEARGLKGLFFINSGLLDIANDEVKVSAFMRERLLITPKLPLTWDGAKTLVAAGQTIGGHTVNHVRLSQVSEDKGREEIVVDKKRHEQVLGIQLLDFAYPFGRLEDRTPIANAVAKAAGYHFVYTSDAGFFRNEACYLIPRVLLEIGQSITSIARWIKGGYDLIWIFRFYLKNIKHGQS